MSKLITSMNVTLDGCGDHRQVIADEELLGYAAQLIESAAGLLFGRVPYELFRDYWPTVAKGGSGTPAQVAFARELEGKPKYVVSRHRTIAGWDTSTVLANDFSREIRALKQRVAGDLVVFGSRSLSGALLRSGEIDEYHLLLQPIVAGHGPRAFDELTAPVRLVHVGSRTSRSGVILLRYVPHESVITAGSRS
jgi:dihydrofolate reductase